MPFAVGSIILGIVLIVGGVTALARSSPPTGSQIASRSRSGAPERPKPFGYEMTDTDLAVLRAVPFRTISTEDAKYGRVTLVEIAEFRAHISALRLWAETLEEGPIRRAYMGWSAHFDHWADAAEHEMATGEVRQKEEADRARIAAIVPSVPKMPVQ